MSAVEILVSPIANACCLLSAIITIVLFLSQQVIFPPGLVKPGAIIFAPDKTNFIAPLSTCCGIIKNGSLRKTKIVTKILELKFYIYAIIVKLE